MGVGGGGGGWGEEERKVFGRGGANSELIDPIRLHMISGRRGEGGCRIFNYLPFLHPPHFPMERP